MHLVQILLPLYDNEQNPQPGDVFRRVRSELTERFGGLTVYTRAPAEGMWKLNDNHTSRDDIVIFEVMADALEREWWSDYRRVLERRFAQEVIMIRSRETEQL